MDQWIERAEEHRMAVMEKEKAYKRVATACFEAMKKENFSLEEAETAIKRIKSAYDNKVSALLRENEISL